MVEIAEIIRIVVVGESVSFFCLITARHNSPFTVYIVPCYR